VDPISDIEVIHTELALADLATVEKACQRAEKAAKAGGKEANARKDFFVRMSDRLDSGAPARGLDLNEEERGWMRDVHLLTAKPQVFIANVGEGGFADNPLLDRVRELALEQGAEVVPVSAALEAELAELDDADKAEFLADYGLAEPGLNRVIRAGYTLLGLRTFFTAGPKEVRAWTVRSGATAPQAAGVIHTDFERGFIRAEVIAYSDYIACRGEQGAKDAGKWRLEGKDYVLKEGDVVHFRFNV
jgi:GTP-binding protein YchF